jgi:putative hemolysin
MSKHTNRFLNVSHVLPALAGDGWRRIVRKLLEWALGLNVLVPAFHAARGSSNPFQSLMDTVGVRLDGGDLAKRLPKNGGVLVVANHPFGGTDALGLTGLCLSIRPDMRIIGNELAGRDEAIGPWIFPVDISGDRRAALSNARSMRNARAHLASGGLLVAFPAGAVSTWRADLGRVADAPWSPHIAALAQRERVPVLPVRFEGGAPAWFHLLGVLHPMVRTALLPRVYLSQRGTTGHCQAGELIEPSELAGLSAEEATHRLRRAVENIRM